METVVCFISVLLFGLANSLTYTIDNANGPLYTVSESYLSVALDTGLIASVDFSNPNFSPLVKHLSPMYFRLGGTTADSALFVNDIERSTENAYGDIIINASFLLQLSEFTKKSNVQVLLDLNSLLRNDDWSWDSSNAEELMKFASEREIELNFELGNEPDLYAYLFDLWVTAEQLSQDYISLRSLMEKYGYGSSYLVGPSLWNIASSHDLEDYLATFLSGVGSKVDAATYHQYYFNGQSATEDLFLNPSTFNLFETTTKLVTAITGSDTKVWLGETSSCSSAGAAGMSDRFLASFLWLDKLGLAAKLGVDVIVRQTVWGYNYPLLNESYLPNPDWWIAVYYKTLVGTKVIDNSHDGDELRTIRLYAHCAKPNSLWGDNAIVVFGENLDSEEGSFSLAGFESKSESAYLFEFTPETDLYSQTVKVNDKVPSLSEDYELPALEPTIVDLKDSYTLPGHSLVFLVIPDTDVAACS